jgi:phage FluMu protein Com
MYVSEVICPKCQTIMEEVGSWTTEYRDYTLYQCPKCMKVEINSEHRGLED